MAKKKNNPSTPPAAPPSDPPVIPVMNDPAIPTFVDPPKEGDKVSYFKSRYSGLSVMDGDQIVARFMPYMEEYQGDFVRVGYLATSNKHALKVLAADPEVVQIKKDEYDKATGDKSVRVGYPMV